MVPSRAKELFWVRELLYTVSPIGSHLGQIVFIQKKSFSGQETNCFAYSG